MSEKLTSRQIAILDFIKKELVRKGYPPALREIGKAVGLNSTSTVHAHLRQLEKKGFIRRDPLKPRTIEILDSPKSVGKKMVNVPLLGKITAGEPILAVENFQDVFALPFDYFHASDAFMLSVRGDSMIEAGIKNGDLVIVRPQNSADNGDIVVALLDDEATIKRFYRETGYVRLQPENPAMEPIITREVTVLGKVIGLIRRLY